MELSTDLAESIIIQDKERDWIQLPIELLTAILSRLSFENIARFRSVCKIWQFFPTPIPHQCPNNRSHWLMFNKQSTSTYHFANPSYKENYISDLPELSDALLRYSKDGWLLMSRGYYSIFFFNPFTKEEIDLPDIPEKWTYLKIKTDLDFEPSNCNPVFYNGVFYCLARDGKLGIFDPNRKILWRVLHQPQPPFIDMVDESYLVECEGQLLSVFLDNHGKMVSLYRLDKLQTSWKTVKNLGDKMLFLSHCSSFAVKNDDGMENKIYFPRFDEGGNGIMFYCLKTRMFQTFGRKFSSKNLYGIEKKLHCCWITPSFE
ncbi:hypothetical protein ACH5RR_024659 [Cinchona calisaya]|uniref:F-box domain-containing protein n=1 Tax=Cinchona calisaya TaxID=153742 RepID=A0ABD2Z0I9_9GENT